MGDLKKKNTPPEKKRFFLKLEKAGKFFFCEEMWDVALVYMCKFVDPYEINERS